MSVKPVIESYLEALDNALRHIPTSERSDIITEIKSHILEAQRKSPNKKIKEILSSLGDPDTVASRYLNERGLKPNSSLKATKIRWFTTGFLTALLILSVVFFFSVWGFMPVSTVDQLMGPNMNLGFSERLKRGLKNLSDMVPTLPQNSEGSLQMMNGNGPATGGANLVFSFDTGTLRVLPSNESTTYRYAFKYTGKVPRSLDANAVNEPLYKDGSYIYDLKESGNIDGVIEVPQKMKLVIKGRNGTVEIQKPESPMDITLDAGQVNISPNSNVKYKFEVHVSKGHGDPFESSAAKDAVPIKVTVTDGYVNRR